MMAVDQNADEEVIYVQSPAGRSPLLRGTRGGLGRYLRTGTTILEVFASEPILSEIGEPPVAPGHSLRPATFGRDVVLEAIGRNEPGMIHAVKVEGDEIGGVRQRFEDIVLEDQQEVPRERPQIIPNVRRRCILSSMMKIQMQSSEMSAMAYLPRIVYSSMTSYFAFWVMERKKSRW